MVKFVIFVISLVLTACPQIAQAKVYDCFIFFNELDVLEIRLNELYDHVDKFVLVESVETFRGNLKPLYYEENKQRFEKFADKIIHVIVNERRNSGNPWHTEAYQRNQIMRGLKDCQPDDTILISDADEIPRATSLPEIYSSLYIEKKQYIQCEQPFYRYYLNARDYIAYWTGTVGTTYEILCKHSPEALRNNRRGGYHTINNAGWHFTFMGGLEYVAKKLESFSHWEADVPEKKTLAFIYDYMRTYSAIVPIDHTYPKFVQDNIPYYIDKGFLFLPFVTVETNFRDILRE